MIAPRVVQEVRRLLAEGKLSQRAIAKVTRVSRGTVSAIATGKRPDYETLRSARLEEESPQAAGPPQRCPGCGGMVYMPCRACETREVAATSGRRYALRPLTQRDEPLELDLIDEHRACYEEVRLQRIARAESAADPIDGWDSLEGDDGEEEYELDPADVQDAFEWDDAEPATDDVSVPDYDEEPFADSMGNADSTGDWTR